MTRLSQYFLPTVKEAPADAEAVSHKLLVRAGMVRQVGAGLWTYLPAGWRAHRKVEQIIREEMDAVGAQEMLMPVLPPAELWKKTGRYDIDELFKLKDRKGAELVLAMTHEETVTFHVAREVRSYRDLPLMLYHFQTKERDEPRPRAGILRTREFIMKDAYTFDRDRAGLDAQYEMLAARLRPHLRPLRARVVQGRVGRRDDGRRRRARVHGALRRRRERGRAVRIRATPPTSRSRAGRRSRSTGCPRRWPRPRRSTRPGATTIEQVASSSASRRGALIKAFPVVADGRGPVLVLVRGDHRVNEIKLRTSCGSGFRQAREDEVGPLFGAVAGFIGPVGAKVPRWSPTRRCAACTASWPAPTSRTTTCAASSPAATSIPSGATSAASRRATRTRPAR